MRVAFLQTVLVRTYVSPSLINDCSFAFASFVICIYRVASLLKTNTREYYVTIRE